MRQYILDRCTDPQNPTLDEVPNEKIPVYDDDDAAEADLANLEVGQIVATKQVYDHTVFDINYPIGVTYTQYPQQKSPNELWGNISTWVELDYSGAFFRSSGGNANGFATSTDTLSSCLQEQATAVNGLTGKTSDTRNSDNTADKTLTGSATTGTTDRTSSGGKVGLISKEAYTCGIFSKTGSMYNGDYAALRTSTDGRYLTIDATHSHNVSISSTNTETRPTNYTVKVWVRTA